jgi:hypothetical protein
MVCKLQQSHRARSKKRTLMQTTSEPTEHITAKLASSPVLLIFVSQCKKICEGFPLFQRGCGEA